MKSLLLLMAAAVIGGQGVWADEPTEEPSQVVVSEYRDLPAFSGRLTGSGVRLRTQPNLDGHIVGELDRGDLLIVRGEENNFFAVAPPEGTKVFVYRTYVLDGKVDGSHVNVRLAPDTEAPIVAQLNTGDLVEGVLCPQSSKWLEVKPPASVKFFVAKEFVEKLGGPELVAQRGKRLREAGHLLNSAYMISQAELSKPFPEIDIERVIDGFEKVVTDYSDLQEEADKAGRVLEMLRDVYGQKRAEFLEAQVADSCTVWDQASAAIAVELEDFCAICDESVADPKESVLFADEERLIDIEIGMEEMHPVEAVRTPQGLVYRDEGTERMRAWEPVEDALYHLWAMDREEPSKNAFYSEQLLDEIALEGVIEPYTQPVKNRPGDYVLKVNHRPVAYLYSTSVDLEQKTGKQVLLKAVDRPNHHFAFPAYFITSVE